jgi:hypothetical protein
VYGIVHNLVRCMFNIAVLTGAKRLGGADEYSRA